MTLLTTTASESTDAHIRVVLVGNERVTRAGLRMLLDGQRGIRVIAEMECASDANATWPSAQADIALVDLDCDGSVDFILRLRERVVPHARLIVLTRTPESTACATVIQRGVLGVVSKQQAPEILVKAVRRVHAGEAWLDRAKIAGMLVAPPDRSESLLPRERQIIALVAQGLRNNEIAQSLLVSEATIRNCLGSIFRKLGISNRVHLLIYSIQEGFANLPVSYHSRSTSRREQLRIATSAGHTLEDTE